MGPSPAHSGTNQRTTRVISMLPPPIAYFFFSASFMHSNFSRSLLMASPHHFSMDGYLALPAERGLLQVNKVVDDESKKMKNGDEKIETTQQSQKKQKNNNGGSSRNNGQEELQTATVVLKVDFHCHGCRRRIFDAARSYRGVESLKMEEEKSKLTVTGKVDPVKLREKLERRTKKKIELLSPQPKKKDSKNNNQSNEKPKEPRVTTVVLKMSLHCDGCVKRIREIVKKTEGVYNVEIDREKELVTVRGVVDPKAVQMRLKMKMKRSAEIVPAKIEKEKCIGEKLEHGGGSQKQQQQQKCICSSGRAAEAMGALDYYGPMYGHISATGYAVERLHAPQIFSDENPHACSVM